MPLIAIDEIKPRLGIETTTYDVDVTRLRAYAIARIQLYLRRPIESGLEVHAGEAWPIVSGFNLPSGSDSEPSYAPPVGEALDQRTDYAAIVQPIIEQAIIDVCADRWLRRNPNASNESSPGVSTSYGAYGLPVRVIDDLRPFRA